MAEMNLVQRALANLLAPAVAGATSAALTQIRARLDVLESRPAGITDAERATIVKAGQMVAQLEALAEGTFDAPAAPADPGGVTVEDVPAP